MPHATTAAQLPKTSDGAQPVTSPPTVGLFISQLATRAAHDAGRNAWWLIARELFGHARVAYRDLPSLTAGDGLDGLAVVVLAGPADADAVAVDRVADWVRDGGSLILAADGPADLVGLGGGQPAADWADDSVELLDCPVWTARPARGLHAVAGHDLVVAGDVEVLAARSGGRPVVTRRRVGGGNVIVLGVDLWRTVVTIRQGHPVVADGVPAPDGTAPIDDAILKCEDGLALDFGRDRAMPPGEPPLPEDYRHTYPPPAAVPVFDQPQADWWAATLLQLVWWAADSAGVPQGWVHYWPAGVPAIAHMSHDSDQNADADAQAALDAFAEAGVSVTWCQVFPGGYSPEIYRAITAAGHEHALHYNAMADADLARWGWPYLRAQYAWAQAVTGADDIVSNKNHYTRWEGWTEFYTWCERLGIQIDESRGPSKQGTVGFTFGSAHVGFPVADAAHANRPLDVLDLPLHTQDLGWAGHLACRDVILDGAIQVHGVAHFLFHGPHLRQRPVTRAACVEVARLARERGMQWWTARRINDWERARRCVEVSVDADAGGWIVRARATRALPGAGIVLHLPGLEPHAERTVPGGRLASVRRYGRAAHELAVDIPIGVTEWRVTR